MSGLTIIFFQYLEHRGTLPKTREDWLMALISIGLIFSSHNKNDNEHTEGRTGKTSDSADTKGK